MPPDETLSKGERTRQAVMEAAYELFLEQGYAATSMRQIAQANNMSDFQIRKIIYGMLQAGLVELVTPPGRVAPQPSAQAVPAGAPAQPTITVKRPVVERLIRFFEKK